ncbi:unnamed protein product, partial [Meganyctiphanes norvegica]
MHTFTISCILHVVAPILMGVRVSCCNSAQGDIIARLSVPLDCAKLKSKNINSSRADNLIAKYIHRVFPICVLPKLQNTHTAITIKEHLGNNFGKIFAITPVHTHGSAAATPPAESHCLNAIFSSKKKSPFLNNARSCMMGRIDGCNFRASESSPLLGILLRIFMLALNNTTKMHIAQFLYYQGPIELFLHDNLNLTSASASQLLPVPDGSWIELDLHFTSLFATEEEREALLSKDWKINFNLTDIIEVIP